MGVWEKWSTKGFGDELGLGANDEFCVREIAVACAWRTAPTESPNSVSFEGAPWPFLLEDPKQTAGELHIRDLTVAHPTGVSSASREIFETLRIFRAYVPVEAPPCL